MSEFKTTFLHKPLNPVRVYRCPPRFLAPRLSQHILWETISVLFKLSESRAREQRVGGRTPVSLSERAPLCSPCHGTAKGLGKLANTSTDALAHHYSCPKLTILVITKITFYVSVMVNSPVCTSSLIEIFLMLKICIYQKPEKTYFLIKTINYIY